MSLLDHLEQQIATLNPSLSSSLHFVVAYSAGIDSHVLLHALWQLQQQRRTSFTLSAIYIHHGLSENASLWQQHCSDVCQKLKIEFVSARVSLDFSNGKGIEAQARDARYAKLIEMAPADSVVMLAQHQDDQLETVLLQLKRGAGPKGLSGMDSYFTKAKLGGTQQHVHFFRPLLDISQQQIQHYANEQSLVWQEDESNQNTDFERNFIRRDVAPLLNERWPHIAQSVSRSAQLCAQQQALLDEVSLEKLQPLRKPNNTLCVKGLLALTDAWRIQVVRLWLDEQNILSPSQAILTQMSNELLLAAEDANPIIQWQSWQLRRFEDALYVITVPKDVKSHSTTLNSSKTCELPLSLGSVELVRVQNWGGDKSFLAIDSPELGQVSLSFGGFSRRFTPQNSPHSKPLKQWYKRWGVPPWERSHIAVICQNEQILGLLRKGEFVPSQYSADLRARGGFAYGLCHHPSAGE
ncbi:tRNA(Ile)-lysidine synthase [Paraglaciecola mesophila]|uniref:tRNA(Ile)-lysidine synthase n=1 Tax=Paraglaciecola mesophila TaxID=197222 RepID=A0A857JIY3_9ALTE|nr:tRNA lysidine(34) synthetase TilS [Paraglaciecola mesophila]QHJ11208.1 tRNA(Ile)-lysidine synthase [Paraglaciecola mesophila]